MVSEEATLPLVSESEIDKHGPEHRKVDRFAIYTQQRQGSKLFLKGQILLGMVILTSGYTLMGRYTRSTVPQPQLYFSSTVVLLAECLKLTLTFFFLLKESNFVVEDAVSLLKKELIDKPTELMKMSLPSFAYALQNNLEFVALSNLEAHVYQVISQLKVVTTALFMMVFLGRTFSLRRWVAILLLFGGVALVQVSQLDEKSTHASSATQNNAFVGLAAILACCATAGFAGVYFEMMLKDGSSTPFWIRNLQMYMCGIAGSAVGCYMTDAAHIKENGFFHGYNRLVVSVVVLMGLNGLYISLVMKLLDNLHKSFASSVSIVVVVLISFAIFPDAHVSSMFFLGTTVVCFAICLYNSVHE